MQETELLAPAGCFPSLRAAIDAGADAVYFGIAQLNMRARARKTFQTEDLAEIIHICHQNNIKGYLTINTLMYDHDLILAEKILKEAKANNVDAAIVADMSTVQICNTIGMEVHISTQLSISNYDALKFYAPYCDRIVLARELNLNMIKAIYLRIQQENLLGRSGKPMEIETFAHGALCIAISGRCGMSLFTSNASANRGACEQNCRKEYEVTDKDTGKKLIIDNEFIMSPNDISTLEFLDTLLESGVKVLKIEGRARSPEYVFKVIYAYRQALNAIQNGTYNKEFVESLYPQLEDVYNRGLSSGYYLGREQGWSEVYGSKARKQKIEIGKITNYFSKLGVAEVEATSGTLKKGDDFIIIGPTTGVMEGITEDMRIDNQTVNSISKGDIFSIKTPGKVRRSDKIYFMKDVKIP